MMTEEKFLKRLELIKRLQNDKIIDKQEAELLLEYEKEDYGDTIGRKFLEDLKRVKQDRLNNQELQYYQLRGDGSNTILNNQSSPGSINLSISNGGTAYTTSTTPLQAYQKGLLNGNNLSHYINMPKLEIQAPHSPFIKMGLDSDD